MDAKSNFDATAVGILKQLVKDQIVHHIERSELQQPTPAYSLNAIKEEFTDIKNKIRKGNLSDADAAKKILTKMDNLDKMMSDVFADLIEQVEGISKRIDDLNADFFSKIFRDVLKEELRHERENDANEVFAHLNEIKH